MITIQPTIQTSRDRASRQALIANLFEDLNKNDESEIALDLFVSISTKHRTLQASFWRVMAEVIKEYGETDSFDPRNEGAVKYCKELSKVQPQIPFI